MIFQSRDQWSRFTPVIPNEHHAAASGHIDFAAWMFRLFTWDGILPFCILLIPAIIARIIPHRGAIEIAAVVLPIIFFFVRVVAGGWHIKANNCSPEFKSLQVCTLVFAVLILMIIDAFIILSHVMPKQPDNNGEDYTITAIIIAIYFLVVSIAMYPGRSKPQSTVFRPQ